MIHAAPAASFPPGPRLPAPLQTLRWTTHSPSLMEACHARYGDLFTLRFVARAVAGRYAPRDEGRWVFLADPEHVKQVFTADPTLVRTGETNRFLLDLVGPSSILVLDEPEHMEHRRLLLPPLHGERVQRYAELIDDVARAEVARWPRGAPLALWPRMQAITLEVIVRVVFGITEPARIERWGRLLTRLLNTGTGRAFVVAQALSTTLRGRPIRRAYDRLVGPVDAAIAEELAHRRAAPDLDARDDILSLLIAARREDGSALTDAELRDELITLLVAGHESTATMLAWAFERLVRHPDMLARVREEAHAGEDVYAEAVVQETLRLRPVLPIVLRRLAAPLELGGWTLPQGAWVAPCAYLVHRRPDVYPDPLAFQPERFLERKPGTYTWTPFGGGVRRCLGASFAQLEMKRVLQVVVSAVELRPAHSEAERIRPRFITLAPARRAEVLLA
ncbi:MAG TPA: cytochrome P450 [Conexibacter sp.]|nr:cytochrome P450 [Conexibacter sp.]